MISISTDLTRRTRLANSVRSCGHRQTKWRATRNACARCADPVRAPEATTQTHVVAAFSQPVGVNRQVVTETVTEDAEYQTVDTFVRSLDTARFQLIEKKDNKEVYLDRRTGKKWKVKVESDD